MGSVAEFEAGAAEFEELGIRIATLQPGQSHGLYHRESTQESFLVLAGECLLLVEGEERTPAAPGTSSTARRAPSTSSSAPATGRARSSWRVPAALTSEVVYPVSELALRHGAGLEVQANNPREAYAGAPDESVERPAYWDELPWA